MQVCGIEIEFNQYDLDNFKKFELGHEKVVNVINEVSKSNEKEYLKAEKICQAIFDHLTEILGQEQASKLITNKKDMRSYVKAFGELYSAINDDTNETNKSYEKYNLNRVKHIKHNSRRFT